MDKYKELFLTTTDTVTGMGAPISDKNEDAIYELKGRERNKPLIIMVGNIEDARKLRGWNNNAEILAKKFWPGRTTLVLTDRIAVRIPGVEGLRGVLNSLGPCYVTSANISGEDTYSLEKAKETFQEITTYYDFGKGSGKSSTIIDVNTMEVLR